MPKAFAVLGTGALLILLLFINALALPVSNLLGWAVPAYLSFKAIESPSTGDDTQWLTYWVVFGGFNFLESWALRPVLYYFPFYFAFKTAFVIYLWLPQTRVSRVSLRLEDCALTTTCFSHIFIPSSPFIQPYFTTTGRPGSLHQRSPPRPLQQRQQAHRLCPVLLWSRDCPHLLNSFSRIARREAGGPCRRTLSMTPDMRA